MTTPHELALAQASLVHEASLALPGEFSQCTYDLGYIKQAVYLCLSCTDGQGRGVCASCSIGCHADHEQIELFPKRHFRCDCPTSGLSHGCSLKPSPLAPSTSKLPINHENAYSQNFFRGGRFCRCAQTYDAKTERETMVQCLSCEDWFHESCLNLRERVAPRETAEPDSGPFPPDAQSAPLDQTQGGPPPPPEQTERDQIQSAPPADTRDAPLALGQIQNAPLVLAGQIQHAPPAQEGNEQDAESVYSSASLPPALLPGDSYETLICGSCVGKIPTVKRYAGARGFRMVVPAEGGAEGFRILGEDWDEEVEVDVVGEEGQEVGTKRRASDAGVDEQASKRPRAEDPNPTLTDTPPSFNDMSTSTPDDPISPTRCTAPPINSLAQTFLADPTAYGDVFLSAGWRERWCRCETCYPSLSKHPFLLEEEETYEPPQDPDAGLSLEELGMRALATLPHERALDSIRAYNAMRDDLMLYLRPFADSGREVREEDITAFFQRRRQGRV